MTVNTSENVDNLVIGVNPPDQHLNRAKWFTLAMLVSAIAGTALTVYLGSQLWDVGTSINQNIHHLFDSIPFDVAFLIGYSTGLMGFTTGFYCLYQFCQN